MRSSHPAHEPIPDERVNPTQDFLSHGPAFHPGFGRVQFGHLGYKRPGADGFWCIPQNSQNIPVDLFFGFLAAWFEGWEHRQPWSRLKTEVDDNHTANYQGRDRFLGTSKPIEPNQRIRAYLLVISILCVE